MGFGLRARKRTGKKDGSAAVQKALGHKSIVLIGLMGAGKTAIGRRLAKRLDLTFTDADSEIEQAAGQNITDIFAEHGEAYFRDGEKRVIARLLENGPQVLATGGGAYMSEETRGNIARHGISVWLNADIDVLLERTGRRDNRPLLKVDDPEAVLKRLMEQRYPVYANADITVQSRDVAHEVIVDEILTALNQKMVSQKNGKRRGS